MRKGMPLAVVVTLWILGGISAAAADKEASVTTELQSGGVSIRLIQYGDLEQKTSRKSQENILPGQEVPLTTIIENLGEECFIRYCLAGNAKSEREIPDTSFRGISEKDIKKGDYVYVREKLKHGEKKQICTAFALPETWQQEEKDEITVKVVVDAVQSRNFKPDFDSNTPWGDIAIQKVTEDEKNQLLRVVVPQKGYCQVILEGDKIVTVPESFFSDFGTIVPGDIMKGEITIENQCDGTEALYWKIDSEENQLLDHSELKIEKGNGEVLYEGLFRNFTDGQYHLLEKYQTKAKDSLVFSIRFPEELDNTYRRLDSKMIWTFRAISEEQESTFSETKINRPVKTGERNHMILFGMLLFSIISFIIVLIRKRRHYE